MKISTETDRQRVIFKIQGINLKQPWVVSAEPYKKDRSLAQNRLSFMWYSELGKHSGNGKEYERNYCKFTYGCEIVIEYEEGNTFNAFYEKLINNYTYEECLEAMEFIQVSSLMKVKAFYDYLTQIERYATEHGWRLTHPDDIYYEAMGK